jgi:hypothetical protein
MPGRERRAANLPPPPYCYYIDDADVDVVDVDDAATHGRYKRVPIVRVPQIVERLPEAWWVEPPCHAPVVVGVVAVVVAVFVEHSVETNPRPFHDCDHDGSGGGGASSSVVVVVAVVVAV